MKQLSFLDDLGIAGLSLDDEPLNADLVRSLTTAAGVPLVIAYGLGVDSTAVLVGLHKLGIRPEAILFADVGAEIPDWHDFLEQFTPEDGLEDVSPAKAVPAPPSGEEHAAAGRSQVARTTFSLSRAHFPSARPGAWCIP